MRTPAFAKFVAALSLAGLLAGVGAPELRAQWYGRNKVQYQRFDFKIMKTRHFDVYFYLQDEATVKMAGMMAERWYSRLSRMFNHELKGRQPLVLYGSSPEFQQTTVIPEILGEGTGGVTESFKRRIVLPYGASLSETDHVIGHELVHAFQYDIMAQGHSDQSRGYDSNLRIPLWFIEGMAEYLSIGPVDANTSMWMRDAVRRKELPEIRKLGNSYKFFPYRWGQAVWAYVTGRWGDEVIGKMMKSVGRTGDYEVILESILGIKMKQLSADWHKSMQDAYAPLLDKTQLAEKIAKPLFKGTRSNPYNIAPAISPDGKSLVFLSSRDLFSVDLFLADAETGEIDRKIISTAVDPHFESIQFIKSAGSYDAGGERFVFGGVAKGRPVLTILDMKKHKIDREIPFGELAEILSPAFSPDGRYITFTGLAGGLSDIFIYDLNDKILKQMTRDPYGDLQPVWSPDGKTIAFVTERFSTNLEWVDVGHYELALLDVESGRIQKLLAFPNGKNINPQWTPDSSALYFLSDQSGKTDLYRIDIATAKISEITNLYAGISGITELSPSISVALGTGRVVFSGYHNGYYTVYSIDDQTLLQGQSFLAQFERNPAILPPRKEPEGALLGLLKNPLFGLPKDSNFAVVPYKPKLGLNYVMPPSVGVGVDRYGTYGTGGVAAYWSDMLGYHTIVTTAFTGSRLIDTSGVVGYLNNRGRFNWGAAAQRIVYPYPYYLFYLDPADGFFHEIEDVFRLINYDVSLFGSYPFSQVGRFQLSAGYRVQDFNHTVYERIYDLNGYLLDYRKSHPNDVPPALSFAYATAGYFYDTGIFGATSPILGQNFGVSVSPALGKVSFTTLTADFRKYFMPVKPFTLAFRALHMGRYGKDSEDTRFYPLYIAYWDLVRGYESISNAELSEYQSDPSKAFDFNRLYGSKMIVANAELRFPLLGLLGLGKGFYGAWPLEFCAFYDWGIAYASNPSQWWGGFITDGEGNQIPDPAQVKPWFLHGGLRKPVRSFGIGLRTNLFGYLVMGLNYVYPIDRPVRGWHLQLSISPGF
ncbi:MAG: BamA/TamA family outer membrane protein [Candidatus Aminicenantales bacterium]